jgi:hypothetical protein
MALGVGESGSKIGKSTVLAWVVAAVATIGTLTNLWITGNQTTQGDANTVGNAQIGGTLDVAGTTTLPGQVNLGNTSHDGADTAQTFQPQAEPAGRAGMATIYADLAGNLAAKTGTTSNGNVICAGSVSDKTDNYPVLVTDLGVGKVLTMNHAATKVFTLPGVGAYDLWKPITFVKLGAGRVTIQAASGQKIADSTVAGDIYNDVAGELSATLTIVPVTTTLWVIVGRDGTWTTE